MRGAIPFLPFHELIHVVKTLCVFARVLHKIPVRYLLVASFAIVDNFCHPARAKFASAEVVPPNTGVARFPRQRRRLFLKHPLPGTHFLPQRVAFLSCAIACHNVVRTTAPSAALAVRRRIIAQRFLLKNSCRPCAHAAAHAGACICRLVEAMRGDRSA